MRAGRFTLTALGAAPPADAATLMLDRTWTAQRAASAERRMEATGLCLARWYRPVTTRADSAPQSTVHWTGQEEPDVHAYDNAHA
jgi:hypothetical protein